MTGAARAGGELSRLPKARSGLPGRAAGGLGVSATRPLALYYRLARFLLRLYFGGICRVRVEDARLPEGSFVISMNHRSGWDMVLYVVILPRRIKFLAKKELLSYPVLRWFVARWCIPVDRGRYDRRALELCTEALRQGYVLSVFPEGTRHAGLAVAHGGAVLLASKAGVPVVPGAIMGGYGPLQHLTVRFGPPMHLPPELNKQQRQEATERLMGTIRGLGATPRAPRRRRRWRERLRLRRLWSRRSRSGGAGGQERAG